MRHLNIFSIVPLAACISLSISQSSFATTSNNVDAWDKAIEIIPEFVDLSTGLKATGDVQSLIDLSPNSSTSYSLPPGTTSFPRKPAGAAGANFGYNIGCDGVNFSNIINSKMDQFIDGMAAFAKNAPSMAVMWIAYSDPTLKAVMDGLDLAANFGLELSNLNCNAGKKLAQSKNFNDWAEAASITECENDDGLCNGDGWASKVVQTKRDLTGQIANYAKDLTASARNTPLYQSVSGGIGSTQSFINEKSQKLNSTGLINITTGGAEIKATSSAKCDDIVNLDPNSTLRLVLSRTELSCDDISYVVQLLPDYTIDELKLIPKSNATLEVSEWYEAIHKDLSGMLTPLVNTSKEDFDSTYKSSMGSFLARTGFRYTRSELNDIRDYFSPSNKYQASHSQKESFIAELVHETSILMMKSSLKRFQRNFSRTSMNLSSPDQESPFDSLRAPYINRINHCVNEIQDIQDAFDASKRIKDLIQRTIHS